ncbi:hypothetical protein VXC91_42670, partial [Streptomyces chiangmaiensis]|nr:hypothetical protein [Streptomyces chiangmaiensis]
MQEAATGTGERTACHRCGPYFVITAKEVSVSPESTNTVTADREVGTPAQKAVADARSSVSGRPLEVQFNVGEERGWDP